MRSCSRVSGVFHPRSIMLLLALFFLLQPARSRCQAQALDSLKLALKTAGADTQKVNLMMRIYRSYFKRAAFDSVLKYANEALQLSEKTGYKKGIAGAYSAIASVHFSQGDYPSSLKFNNLALEIRLVLGDRKDLAASYNNIGNIYAAQGNYPEGLRYFLQALKMRDQDNDKPGMASSHVNLGNLDAEEGNWHEALKR